MSEVYEAIVKVPMLGKKDCTITMDRSEGGVVEGTFTALGSSAPIVDGKIDGEGNFTGACKLDTAFGEFDTTYEGKITDGKIDGVAHTKLGDLEFKSAELW